MQKISPSLWFDNDCEEAMNFYVSLFPGSKVNSIQKYPEKSEDPHLQGMNGKVLHGDFELAGMRFIALDGGPLFKFNPSISFFLNFDPSKDPNARENLDKMWSALSDGGKVMMELGEYPHSKRYGWLEDKYGITWQLMLTNPDGDERPFIIPSLLFTGKQAQAEAAIKFYLSVFRGSEDGQMHHYDASQMLAMADMVMFADFSLESQWFAAMDGGDMHDFSFNEAISFMIECKDQNEIDYYWNNLSAVPEAEQCGWIKDKFGISWQIVPTRLGELMADPDKEKAGRVMEALMKMKKIDISQLEEVYTQ